MGAGGGVMCIIRYNYVLLTLSKLFTLSICNIFLLKGTTTAVPIYVYSNVHHCKWTICATRLNKQTGLIAKVSFETLMVKEESMRKFSGFFFFFLQRLFLRK